MGEVAGDTSALALDSAGALADLEEVKACDFLSH